MIDTFQKRFSASFVLLPWRGIAVVPSGTVTQAARQAVSFLYSGILASGPVHDLANWVGVSLHHAFRRGGH